MKTKKLSFATASASGLLAGIIFIHGAITASAQGIDPATGLPAAKAGAPGIIDPTTGLFLPKAGNNPAEGMVDLAYRTDDEVRKLMADGEYNEALKRCLAFHDKCRDNTALVVVLADWIELGHRYPQARKALVEIRDHDVREFSEGRGYWDLFHKVTLVNDALEETDSTYDLFTRLRKKDPGLAQHCFLLAERLLMAHGEYQWCYDHMGDPLDRFDSIHQGYDRQLAQQKRYAEMCQMNAQRMAELYQKMGRTNYASPDPSMMMKNNIEKNFTGQIRELIEILVATDHKADAEKIRDEAVAVLDNARLHSAVSDAEEKLHKTAQAQISK